MERRVQGFPSNRPVLNLLGEVGKRSNIRLTGRKLGNATAKTVLER